MPNHTSPLAPILTLAVALAATAASAQELVLLDHFDDATLDPDWQVSFENADGWSFAESGTDLLVTDISHVATDSWANVRLTRPVSSLGDFSMRAEIAWASGGFDANVMQSLIIRMLDANGALVAQAYFWDAWNSWSGTIGGNVADGSSWNGGHHFLPYDGTGAFEIERTGDEVTVRVEAEGGIGSVTGLSSTPVEQVQIVFQFYPYAVGGNVVSYFGSESIDLIEITRPSPCAADLAEPFGTLDFSDVIAFLAAFGAGDPAADLAAPEGVFDFSDVVAFLSAFGAGCP